MSKDKDGNHINRSIEERIIALEEQLTNTTLHVTEFMNTFTLHMEHFRKLQAANRKINHQVYYVAMLVVIMMRHEEMHNGFEKEFLSETVLEGTREEIPQETIDEAGEFIKEIENYVKETMQAIEMIRLERGIGR